VLNSQRVCSTVRISCLVGLLMMTQIAMLQPGHTAIQPVEPMENMDHHTIPFNKNVVTFSFKDLSAGYVTLRISGRFYAARQDHKILVRINGKTDGYQSSCSGGEPAILLNVIEYEQSAIFIGRSGWLGDADFLAEVSLSIIANGGIILASSHSVFFVPNHGLGNQRCSGAFPTFGPLQTLEIVVSPDAETDGSATIDVQRP
jgi:hypothetical protein